MKTKVYIQNLKCGGCARTITKKLSELEDIGEVYVNVEESSVSFDYLDEMALHHAQEVLKFNGYPVVGNQNTLGDKAKSMVSCAIGKIH
jgi:copper chaperone CopZ